MSLTFLTINDFIGEVNLDLSNDSNVQAQFEAMAGQIEEDYLRDLLNDKLYEDFINDLIGGVPQTQNFIDLLNGKTYVNPSGETVKYDGLKRMLKYFIYSETLDYNWSNNASTGQLTSNNENSTLINRADLRKVRAKIHNKGINLYNKAATFINDNYTDYFTDNDYSFWLPKVKRYIGKITSVTPMNRYFYNRSSTGN
jgi:hypothetical protein